MCLRLRVFFSVFTHFNQTESESAADASGCVQVTAVQMGVAALNIFHRFVQVVISTVDSAAAA